MWGDMTRKRSPIDDLFRQADAQHCAGRFLWKIFAGQRKKRCERFTPSQEADEGNRTLVCSLGSCRSTIELHPQMIFKSISIIAKIAGRVKAGRRISPGCVLVCQTYVTHYAESFLESPLEISNPVVSSGSYCISCCESSTALKNLRKSRICV